MNTIHARAIVDTPWGGVANRGHQILFDLRFANGERERYACPTSAVPLLLGNLTQYAAMAEAVRTTEPDRAIVQAAPYKVTEVVSTAHSTDGRMVTVNYNTTHGFPLSIAMTPDQVWQTI